MKARGANVLTTLTNLLGGMPIRSGKCLPHPDGYLCASAEISTDTVRKFCIDKVKYLYADISMSALTKITCRNRPTTLFNLSSFYMKDEQDLDAPAIELDEKIWKDFESVHKGVLRDMLFGIDEHNRSRNNVEDLGYYRPTMMFNAPDEDIVYGIVSDYFLRYCHQ